MCRRHWPGCNLIKASFPHVGGTDANTALWLVATGMAGYGHCFGPIIYVRAMIAGHVSAVVGVSRGTKRFWEYSITIVVVGI